MSHARIIARMAMEEALADLAESGSAGVAAYIHNAQTRRGGVTQFVSGARAAYLTRKHGPAAAMEDAWSVWYDHGIKRAYRYYA